MFEDMLVWKIYIQRDITKLRNHKEKEISKPEKKEEKKILTPVRVLEILILGIFGPITLIAGIYAMSSNFVVGLPIAAIGAVFVIALILNEIFR